MAQQAAGVLDSFLPTDLCPAFVAGKVQHQIPREPGIVPESRIRSAKIRYGPCLPGRRKENRPGLTVPDCLTDQFSQLSADGNAPGLPGLAGGLIRHALIPAMRVS